MLVFIIVFISNPSYFWDEDDQQIFVGFRYGNILGILLQKIQNIFNRKSIVKTNWYDKIPNNSSNR